MGPAARRQVVAPTIDTLVFAGGFRPACGLYPTYAKRGSDGLFFRQLGDRLSVALITWNETSFPCAGCTRPDGHPIPRSGLRTTISRTVSVLLVRRGFAPLESRLWTYRLPYADVVWTGQSNPRSMTASVCCLRFQGLEIAVETKPAFCTRLPGSQMLGSRTRCWHIGRDASRTTIKDEAKMRS